MINKFVYKSFKIEPGEYQAYIILYELYNILRKKGRKDILNY